MQFSGNSGLIVPARGILDAGRVIPDGVFLPAESRVLRNAPPWMTVKGVELVLGVTSSRPELDRKAKRHAYAEAGIPLYLLVDRREGRTSLFSHPAQGDYSRTLEAKFGEKLDLPVPFGFALDTSPFAD
jgi:Uma2 family endonuclease